MPAKLRLLIAESVEFSEAAIHNLQQHFTVELADLPREQLLERIVDVDILWVRLRNNIDQPVIRAARQLKMIVSATTGLNHIDCDYAASRNVRVVSLRGETEFLREIRGTAELTIGLMLALLRKIPSAHEHVIGGGWDRYPFKGHEIYRKTVGVIGFGRLGSIVAEYLRALGARVLATDSKHIDREMALVEFVELPELLRRSDIVTLHASYRDANVKMIGRHEFGQMKAGAYFINTARGELVDEEALLEALESGHVAGAALDVLANEGERAAVRRPLVDWAARHDNLLLTPHIGGNTFESMDRTEQFLAEKVIALLGESVNSGTNNGSY